MSKKVIKNTKWSPKIFALLLTEAKGDRSWRRFALDCDISYVQMRKLHNQEQQNPPRPKLIQKISANSFNDIDMTDFLFAAGLTPPDTTVREPDGKLDTFRDKYRVLSTRDKKLANVFLNYLIAKSKGIIPDNFTE